LKGPLRVVGGQIYDANGRVTLRGVNFNGAETAVEFVPRTYFPDHLTIDHMQAWGSNTFRLLLSEDYWNAAATLKNPQLARQICPRQNYDIDYQSKVADAVNYATNVKGMLVLIDLHSSNPGCLASGYGGDSTPLPGPGAETFWTDVATQFGGNSLVAFELYNEPHVCYIGSNRPAQGQNPTTGCPEAINVNDENNATVWANGSDVAYANSTYRGVGLDALFTRVRGLATNLVFVDPNSNAGDPYTFATTAFTRTAIARDPNVVFVGHMYPWSATCDWVKGAADWFTYWAHRRYSQPIVWDEFGWSDPNDPVATSLMVDVFDSEGQGWSAFAFTGTPDSSGNAVKFALLKRQGVSPDDASPMGQPVKNALQGTYPRTCLTSAPKSPTGLSADPGDHAAILKWTPPSDAFTDAAEYTINYTPAGGSTATASARCYKDVIGQQTECNPWTLAGLANGTAYAISLTATNIHGSTTSASISVTPHDLAPGQPRSVTAQSGNQTTRPASYNPTDPTITVTWAAPVPNGGSAVTSYTIEAQRQTGSGYGTAYTYRDIVPSATSFVAHIPTAGLYRMVVFANNVTGSTAGYPRWDQSQSQWNVAPA
jgi:hypothetical protein